MTFLDIPDLSFDKWRKWAERPRPSLDLDVFSEFGIIGLYILAEFTSDLDVAAAVNLKELPEKILYIGMSTNVHRRLEKTHRAIQMYLAQEYADTSTTWQSDWHNSSPKRPYGIISRATLALYERALNLVYARKYARFPKLNRE